MLNTSEINELKKVLDDHVPGVILKLIHSYFDDCPLQYINELYVPDIQNTYLLRIDNDLYNCYEIGNKRIYTKIIDTNTLEMCLSSIKIECKINEFITSLKYNVMLRDAMRNKNDNMIYCNSSACVIHIENKLLQHYFPKKLHDIKIISLLLYKHKLYFISIRDVNICKLFRFDLRTRKLYYITKFKYIPGCYINVSKTYICILNTTSPTIILRYNKKNLQNNVITHHINNIDYVTDSHVYGNYKNSNEFTSEGDLLNELIAESIDQLIEPYQICKYHKMSVRANNICVIINDITSMIFVYKIK